MNFIIFDLRSSGNSLSIACERVFFMCEEVGKISIIVENGTIFTREIRDKKDHISEF